MQAITHGAVPAQVEMPIPGALCALQNALARLEDTTANMGDRFCRVLKPTAPTTASNGNSVGSLAPAASNSQIFEQIENATRMADRINEQLRDYIGRAEV